MESVDSKGTREHTVSVRLLRCGYYGHGAIPCQIASGGRPLGSTGPTSFRVGW
jgi:hypothetical protein